MRHYLYFIGLFFILILSSCGNWINSDIMLKTGKDYAFDALPDSTQINNYRISPNDMIEFTMFSNEGFKLIDLTSLNEANRDYQMNQSVSFLVTQEGNAKLPILGLTKLSGLTVTEAETQLEEKYSKFYIDPYVFLKVNNRRVIVFPGNSGDAKVIPLLNNNTTLIEALALAGGISDNGKAKKIKIIRKVDNKNMVYLIDLSTIEGIKNAQMVLQANDIVYVEPRRKYSSKFIQEIAPIISVLSSIVIVISVTNR